MLWGKSAETLSEYLVKGKQIYVEGRLQTRQWDDKDGNKRYTTEIRGDRIVLLGGGGGGRRRVARRPALRVRRRRRSHGADGRTGQRTDRRRHPVLTDAVVIGRFSRSTRLSSLPVGALREVCA